MSKKKSTKVVKPISLVKRHNQKRNKLLKQGKLKPKIQKRKRAKYGSACKPNANSQPNENQEGKASKETIVGKDMANMMENEDFAFLKEAVKTNTFSMLQSMNPKNSEIKQPQKHKLEETEMEREYEEQTAKKYNEMKELLPIKTVDGIVRRTLEIGQEEPEAEAGEKEQEEEQLVFDETQDEEQEKLPPVSVVQLYVERQQKLQEKKMRIGLLARNLLAQPEEKRMNLNLLIKMLKEEDPAICITVQKLVLASLLEVFRDLLPGYQIVHGKQEGQKLKKDEKHLQKFENHVIECYRQYLVKLEKMMTVLKPKRNEKMERGLQVVHLGEFSLWCLCELLVDYPYFNFSSNIVHVVVNFLNHSSPSVRHICSDAIKKVFRADIRGWISLQIVKKINNFIKTRKYRVKKDLLEVLLALRIKKLNLEKEQEEEIKKKKFLTHREKLRCMSRKERRRSKHVEKVEKELMAAQAEENKVHKNRYFTEVMSVVFAIYFRVLKSEQKREIIDTVLEGLAQFAHLINVDFFQDLSTELNRLLESGVLTYRSCLHCVQVVFTILSGQGESLIIDPQRFYIHLYQALLQLNAGPSNSDVPSALQSINTVLNCRRKKITQQCVHAFAKRLCIMALHMMHNGTIATLATVKTILMTHKSADVLLDPDVAVGSGAYMPEIDNPEHCNAGSTTLWELHTLHEHYHPVVRNWARHIMLGLPMKGEGCLPLQLLKKSSEELFQEYDSCSMVFNPAVTPPKKINYGPKRGRFALKSLKLQETCDNILRKDTEQDIDFYRECCK